MVQRSMLTTAMALGAIVCVGAMLCGCSTFTAIPIVSWPIWDAGGEYEPLGGWKCPCEENGNEVAMQPMSTRVPGHVRDPGRGATTNKLPTMQDDEREAVAPARTVQPRMSFPPFPSMRTVWPDRRR